MPLDDLERLLRSKAVLLPGTTVTFTVEKTGRCQRWRYDGGLQQYLLGALGAEPVAPLFEAEGYVDADDETFAEGEGARWVLAWTEDGPVTRESYVNLIPTPAGGTHEAGLREGMFNAMRRLHRRAQPAAQGGEAAVRGCLRAGQLRAHPKVLDPQFQGQIKERLNSRDSLRLVAGQVKPQLEIWLNQHPEHGRALADLVIRQAQARARAAQKVEKKKGSAVAVLPGKLPTASRPTSRATNSWPIKSWTVPRTLKEVRLDVFARRCLPHLSRRALARAIRDKLFNINGKIGKKGLKLKAGDALRFTGHDFWLAGQPVPAADLAVSIVYEDAALLAVNKPGGMAKHGFSGRETATLANVLAAMHPELCGVGHSRWQPGLVHRLDRETSGLVLVAKTQAAFEQLRQQFRRRQITKKYLALVWGNTASTGSVAYPLAHNLRDKRRMCALDPSDAQEKGRKHWQAVTRFRELSHAQGLTLLEVFATNKNTTFNLLTCPVFLIAALWFKRTERLNQYWRVTFAFFVASVAYPITGLSMGWLLDSFSIVPSTTQGLALGEVVEVLMIVVPILVLTKLSGADMGSIYLKRGDLRLGLGIGGLVFVNFATSGLMFFAMRFTSMDLLRSAIVWGLVFSFANGFMEELWLRGILLRRFQPFIGVHGSVWLTAIIFA